MVGKSYCFWPEKPFKFLIWARKSLQISAKTFFFLEITWFWPEKPFKFLMSARKSLRISAKTFFFFGDHLIFTKNLPKSNSEIMKIWVKFVYGTHSQKILATCLFFTKVQSTLKKRPPSEILQFKYWIEDI